jgi:asparagine synthase (glutamine-hydrolysing)
LLLTTVSGSSNYVLLPNWDVIVVGSEIKQTLALPDIGPRPNLSRLYDFLVSGVADHTGKTMWGSIRLLRCGECMTEEAGRPWAGAERPRRWCVPMMAPVNTCMTEAQATEGLRDLLCYAVRMHLRSDVPNGSSFSDAVVLSSIIYRMANPLYNKAGRGEFHALSACSAKKTIDGKSFMDVVIAVTGVAFHFGYPRAEGAFAFAGDKTWLQNESFGSISIFAQWRAFDEAQRTGIKVMLNGQGADEPLDDIHSSFPYHMSVPICRGRMAMALRTMLKGKRWSSLVLTDQFRAFLLPRLHALLARLVSAVVHFPPARSS